MPFSKKPPKETPEISWTKHAIGKMGYYAISESGVKKVLRRPKRIEEGIAPNTVAVMQPTTTKRPQEIWVMYQLFQRKGNKSYSKRIISTWRYPGKSPIGKAVYIPEDTLQELERMKNDED